MELYLRAFGATGAQPENKERRSELYSHLIPSTLTLVTLSSSSNTSLTSCICLIESACSAIAMFAELTEGTYQVPYKPRATMRRPSSTCETLSFRRHGYACAYLIKVEAPDSADQANGNGSTIRRLKDIALSNRQMDWFA